MEGEGYGSFSKWRQRLWPIHSFELKKIVPLLSLKFLISLIYSILLCLKDTVVVTAQGSGAEVIPVIKGWIVLPVAILGAVIYSKLSNLLKPTTLFYSFLGFLLFVYALYGFVLYPNIDFFSPHASADRLAEFLGGKHSHWVAIYRNWIHTLFFVAAELWSTIVIFLLFWGFANQITRVGEAKRTYTLFIAAGDIGALLTGPIFYYFTKHFAIYNYSITLAALTSFIIFLGGLTLGIYWWVNRYVLTDERFYDPAKVKQTINQKTKLSLMASIKYIFKSKYLLSIAMLVIGCGLAINIVEVTWKGYLKLQYPNPIDMQAFFSQNISCVGGFALITVLLFGGSSLRYFGWHFSAMVTPAVIGVTGLLFFFLCLGKDHIGPLTSLIGLSPLMFIVLFGAFQVVISKVVKYSFFDPTKEMVFIPLDQESKTKGKAAIDVIGSRLGKSGSSWIQIALIDFLGTGSVLSITPYLLPIIATAIILWMMSVRYLNKEFTAQDRSLSLSS
jgi:AAA family ATP:ADP antiporter